MYLDISKDKKILCSFDEQTLKKFYKRGHSKTKFTKGVVYQMSTSLPSLTEIVKELKVLKEFLNYCSHSF